MKRLWAVLLAMLLLLPLTACQQQKPANAIPIQTAKFKYRGSLVWLYRDAAGKVNMLRGNARDITAVTRGNGEVFTAGKGQWTTVKNVTKDQLVYVKNGVLEQSAKKDVISQPDYVLSLTLKELSDVIPEALTDSELAALQAEFESELLLDKNPLVTITMEDGQQIIIELYPEIAPNTVNSFVYLAQRQFYDGTIFHRVIPKFMIQGGDPLGTGTGGPGYSIPGEFNSNGFSNSLLHTRGVISMARNPQSYNSAGSQFFIMVADVPDLDGDYATFGKVLSGLETVDKIVNLPRDVENNDRPNDPPVMQSVTVETFGATYPPPFVISNSSK